MSKLYPVYILMLRPRQGDPLFVAGGRPAATAQAGEEPEPQGRIARIKAGALRAYDALSHRFDHQENTCAQLRHASQLHLRHPDTLHWREAMEVFENFLKVRRSKHYRWRILNLLAAGFGALLTPIPGPNVFFFYPAARLVGHHFALSGIARAETLGVGSVEAEPLLTRMEQNLQRLDELEPEVQELEDRYRPHQLKRVLESLCPRKSRSS